MGVLHCCYRSGLHPCLELCHELDGGNKQKKTEKRDKLIQKL